MQRSTGEHRTPCVPTIRNVWEPVGPALNDHERRVCVRVE